MAVEVSFESYLVCALYLLLFQARGGGRGGFQQRDAGPPDTVLGTFQHLLESAMFTHSW